MFVVFCKCKDCVLFASLSFHNELANFASARLLLIVAICFAQVVAQLLKPHLMAFVAFDELFTELKLCLGETTHQISGVTIVYHWGYFDKKPDEALNKPRMLALLIANSPSAKHVK